MISELSTSYPPLQCQETRTMTSAIYTRGFSGELQLSAALSTITAGLTVGSLLLFMKISQTMALPLVFPIKNNRKVTSAVFFY